MSLSNHVNIILAFWLLCGVASGQDSLKAQYSIVGMNFYGDYDIVKIKVPPWLKTSQVMEQIKLSTLGPGATLPKKKTYIYVFKETDQIGDTSSTGAVYIPGKGYIWCLNDWTAKEIPKQIPTKRDLEIYYTLVDEIITNGSTLDDLETRRKVAQQYLITVAELDSIYSWVKYWISSHQEYSK